MKTEYEITFFLSFPIQRISESNLLLLLLLLLLKHGKIPSLYRFHEQNAIHTLVFAGSLIVNAVTSILYIVNEGFDVGSLPWRLLVCNSPSCWRKLGLVFYCMRAIFYTYMVEWIFEWNVKRRCTFHATVVWSSNIINLMRICLNGSLDWIQQWGWYIYA